MFNPLINIVKRERVNLRIHIHRPHDFGGYCPRYFMNRLDLMNTAGKFKYAADFSHHNFRRQVVIAGVAFSGYEEPLPLDTS